MSWASVDPLEVPGLQSPLWTPDAGTIERHSLTDFATFVERTSGQRFDGDYSSLHRWSVSERGAFWTSLLAFTEVQYSGSLVPALLDGDALPGARWFPEMRLNYAENLLRGAADAVAAIACDESGYRREHTYDELRGDVGRHQRSLLALGVEKGDVVAAVLPNRYESLVAMLAAASIGAVWCSVSPDFGVNGILDRFCQVQPRVLYAVRGYRYAGRYFDISDKLGQLIAALPGLRQTIICGDDAGSVDAITAEHFLSSQHGSALEFLPLPFDHPLYILFTSGTTGVPKGIVHGAGGTLLQLLKEHRLHCDVRSGDRMLFPSTLGWMMWNWLVNGLAARSAIVLYDGSFTHPSANVLFDIAQRERVTLCGMSSAFLESCRKAGVDLRSSHTFCDARMVFAGGSVLSPDGHRHASERIFPRIPIASCSGGTDIVSCFLITNPWAAIWAGELQAPGLGMDVDVFDEQGRPCRQRKGELVCRQAVPSMPLGFVNDPDGRRYRAAYFERFPGVWAHGDFIATTEHDGFVIYGRSDAVLNPGGVRIGTAEIYRQVDTLAEVVASVAVGEEVDGDITIALFVKLAPGVEFTEALAQRIRDAIRTGASPRHVPKRIDVVADIPLTRTGKIAETAVREAVNGRPIKNTEALANPEALLCFVRRATAYR